MEQLWDGLFGVSLLGLPQSPAMPRISCCCQTQLYLHWNDLLITQQPSIAKSQVDTNGCSCMQVGVAGVFRTLELEEVGVMT